MWNLVTLEGFFDGAEPWQLDWHLYVWGPELERISMEQRDERTRMELLEAIPLCSGCVFTRYRPVPAS